MNEFLHEIGNYRNRRWYRQAGGKLREGAVAAGIFLMWW